MGEIRENQQVKLSFKTFDETEKELTCRVKSFKGDRLALKPSTELDAYVDYLHEGDEVKVQLFTPLGVKLFDALILDSPSEPEFVIEYVENSVQIQRRDYIRVPLKAKIVIERDNREVIITETVDLSGGGVRFLHKGGFNENEIVKLSLYLKNERLIIAKGLILTNEHLPEGQKALFFDEIEEKDRNIIIKKCFGMQLNVE